MKKGSQSFEIFPRIQIDKISEYFHSKGINFEFEH